MKCPGQNSQYWKPEDIFEVECSRCGYAVEFFKDDVSRNCDECGLGILNPKRDFGCAAHCAAAETCKKEIEHYRRNDESVAKNN
ncbi:MAG: hypothetical protein GY866_35460 [Proteobacteria bacterium]|nr:hypothetical protein [Pseudomonadota bacterium]